MGTVLRGKLPFKLFLRRFQAYKYILQIIGFLAQDKPYGSILGGNFEIVGCWVLRYGSDGTATQRSEFVRDGSELGAVAVRGDDFDHLLSDLSVFPNDGRVLLLVEGGNVVVGVRHIDSDDDVR